MRLIHEVTDNRYYQQGIWEIAGRYYEIYRGRGEDHLELFVGATLGKDTGMAKNLSHEFVIERCVVNEDGEVPSHIDIPIRKGLPWRQIRNHVQDYLVEALL